LEEEIEEHAKEGGDEAVQEVCGGEVGGVGDYWDVW